MSRLSWGGLLIFLPAILQLCAALTFDLGVDEAHYMLYARHLDLSYFDHPPLVGWTHFLFNFVFGENLFSARLPAILCGAFSSWQCFRFLREQNVAEKTAVTATLAIGLCWQFFVLNLFLLPDTLCLALFWPLMRMTVLTAQKPIVRHWLGLGFFLGLMGLAKYTGVFFLLPIAILILSQQRLRILKQPGFYLAVLLAAALVSPILIWNQARDWLSFRYQGAHVLGGEHGLESVLKSFVLQFATYSPFLWFFAIWGIWQLWRRKGASAQFALWSAVAFGLFFGLSSWKATVLPHWPAQFYMLAIPMGLAYFLGKKPIWARVAIGLTASVNFLLVFLLVTGWGARIPGALKEVSGWPEFMPQVLAKLEKPTDRVVVLNWTYGSRAMYYAGPGQDLKVLVLDDRTDQFDLWNPEKVDGRDLWIVQFSYDEKDLSSTLKCDSWGPPEMLPIFKRGVEQYQVIFQKCVNATSLISGS